MISLKEINKEYRLESNYLSKVIATIKDRIRNIHDISDLCSYYFVEPNYESKDAMALKNKLKQPAIGKTDYRITFF